MAQKSPQKLWTPANIVTVVRLVAIFGWIACAEAVAEPRIATTDSSPLNLGVLLLGLFFALIASTDFVDGYLARSRDEVTDFGKFLDPIADKLVVVVALLVLMQWDFVSIWVLVVIVAREFIVSALRMVLAEKGIVVAASGLGKLKTACTMVAIVGMFVAGAFITTEFGHILFLICWILIWISVILTIWSGVDYVVKGWKYLA